MALVQGDRVITPRDDVGFVQLVTPDGFVHGEYVGALSPRDAFWTLHASLLVAWRPHQPRPKPVRKGVE